MLTLTGIGGGGKTRLAIRAAEKTLDAFPDGAWLVDLAPLTDGDRVRDTIAATLGAQQQAAAEARRATLTDWVREKRMLLILDNCEHPRPADPSRGQIPRHRLA